MKAEHVPKTQSRGGEKNRNEKFLHKSVQVRQDPTIFLPKITSFLPISTRLQPTELPDGCLYFPRQRPLIYLIIKIPPIFVDM